jgi:hypothetical protein
LSRLCGAAQEWRTVAGTRMPPARNHHVKIGGIDMLVVSQRVLPLLQKCWH